jgi:hypothetical protein
MLVTIVNCANGRVVWVRVHRNAARASVWVCLRDKYQLISPDGLDGVQQFVSDLTSHSQLLAGNIQSFQQFTF